MPVSIKLRRSAVQGQLPTTSNLLLGELAINTYDARVFVKGSTSGNETGAGTSIVQLFNATGGAITGDVTLNAQSDLRFADSDSSNWVAFQAPGTISSNVTWTLPSADATSSGQVLSSNAAGTLSWVTPSGSGDVTLAGNNAMTGANTFAGNTTLLNQADLRFGEATGNGSNWVALQAPASIAADVTWTLPDADGTTGQVLSTNGTGTLSWATASGGSGSSAGANLFLHATCF